MNTRSLLLALGFAALAAAAACSKSEPQPPKHGAVAADTAGADPAAVAVDSDKVKSIYQERCSACHGANGRGDGPGAAALNPKPRNYTDKAWQAKVTDEQIKRTITYGGAAVGKSPIMPASPDLEQKPEVVDGLVKIVRQFGS